MYVCMYVCMYVRMSGGTVPPPTWNHGSEGGVVIPNLRAGVRGLDLKFPDSNDVLKHCAWNLYGIR